MERPLAGRVILVIEDEPLIALDIQQAFEEAGAATLSARTLADALNAVEEPTLSAAIVDHVLGDDDSSELCQRLEERNIPFVTYSGIANVNGPCGMAKHIDKPASPSILVTTVKALLARHPISN